MSTVWQSTGAEVLIGSHSSPSAPTHSLSKPVKIAAFDLDLTLTVSKTGRIKCEDPDDWTWWHESVPSKLQKTSLEGFQIVIFTNQGRLTTKDGSEAPAAKVFKEKVEAIFCALGVPVTICAACANDNWRKPRTRAWDHFIDGLGRGRMVDLEASYMVGDAAGRPTDHTDDDRHFSMNVGIRLYTPEEYFLGAEPQAWEHKFDPSWHLDEFSTGENSYEIPNNGPILLLLVGLPGSGKTSYYFNTLRTLGYERVAPSSSDCSIDRATDMLKAGKCGVVDDTNGDQASRQKWITISRTCGAQVFAAQMLTPPELCLHNDAVRALGGPQMNWEGRSVYPRVPFWDLVKSFEPPQEVEGLDGIFTVPFKWTGTEEALSTWRKFWV
ncbi:polynucleotide kinase 3 phosphatase-domain-containing protein [Clohesyomyces aquaticus]|uniref:Polynucleotide kinase 3 phosphatase-domain-containing protein n=1 Tax=Clohesyomyces aquaticus TaxID=1231657 RepID=A0A1Y1YAG0_9PLEO|nr:polynucleotide kinase 3 phosphatase-domain-containing protein [Clohesyomyces aquaticus]